MRELNRVFIVCMPLFRDVYWSIAVKVVDLQNEQLVTNANPLGKSAKVDTICGIPSSSIVGIFVRLSEARRRQVHFH